MLLLLPLIVALGLALSEIGRMMRPERIKSDVPYASARVSRGMYRVVDAYTGEPILGCLTADATIDRITQRVYGPRGEMLPDPDYPDELFVREVFRPIAILYRHPAS